MKAFAWRDGRIEFGPRCPTGARVIAEGPARELRGIVEVNARQAYDGATLLVPGIPEAETDLGAEKALRSFKTLVRHRLAGGSGWPAPELAESAR